MTGPAKMSVQIDIKGTRKPCMNGPVVPGPNDLSQNGDNQPSDGRSAELRRRGPRKGGTAHVRKTPRSWAEAREYRSLRFAGVQSSRGVT